MILNAVLFPAGSGLAGSRLRVSVVRDPEGIPVSGAEVLAENLSGGALVLLQEVAMGVYSAGVPAGSYAVRVPATRDYGAARAEVLVSETGGSVELRVAARVREIAYAGITTELSAARSQLAAAATPGHILFAGGYAGSVSATTNTVDAYDESLTRSAASPLTTATGELQGMSVGEFVLFAGGHRSDCVDSYNDSLTKSLLCRLAKDAVAPAGAALPGLAFLGGGGWYYSNSYTSSAYVDAWDASLVRLYPQDLSSARRALSAAVAGDHVVFAGGFRSSSTVPSGTVDAYDSSLTRSNPAVLPVYRHSMGAASVGAFALFAGGVTSNGSAAAVDAYDASLTRRSAPPLSLARGYLAGTALGPYALFAGGEASGTRLAVTEAYDASLTRSLPDSLSVGRKNLAAAALGSMALFGGGVAANGINTTVDVFRVV